MDNKDYLGTINKAANRHNKQGSEKMMSKIVIAIIVCGVAIVTGTNANANGVADITVQEAESMTVEQLKTMQAEIMSAISSEIGNAKCTQDNQCDAIPIGANPCGGPEAFKVFSTAVSDAGLLNKLSNQHHIVRKTLVKKLGLMGACVVIPKPKVQCKNNMCTAVETPQNIVF
ncbi:hypothetical protein [Kaarinaea lacus]